MLDSLYSAKSNRENFGKMKILGKFWKNNGKLMLRLKQKGRREQREFQV